MVHFLVFLLWMRNRREWMQKVSSCFVLPFTLQRARGCCHLCRSLLYVKWWQWGLLDFCTWICVRQIPKHFDSYMHSVVMIKPKSYICQGHSWSCQKKALCWSVEISYPLGKHSGLQSRAAWGLVFTRDSSTSHRLFKIPRERLHIACSTICFWTLISYFRVDYWMKHSSFKWHQKRQVGKILGTRRKSSEHSSPFYKQH